MINSAEKSDNQYDLTSIIDVLKNSGFLTFKHNGRITIACDAAEKEPVELLVKRFGEDKNCDLVLLVDNVSRIQSYTDHFPDIAWDLFEISEKPLIIVLEGLKNVANVLIHNDFNVGFELAGESLTKNLCARLRKPLFCVFTTLTSNENILFLTNETTHEVKIDTKNKLASKVKLGKGNQIEILRS